MLARALTAAARISGSGERWAMLSTISGWPLRQSSRNSRPQGGDAHLRTGVGQQVQGGLGVDVQCLAQRLDFRQLAAGAQLVRPVAPAAQLVRQARRAA